MERPLLLPLVSLISGLVVADTFLYPLDLSLLGAALLCALLSFFVTSSFPFKICISLLFFLVGHLSLQPYIAPNLPANHIARHATDDTVIVEGVIDSRPQFQETGGRLWLQVEKIISGKALFESSGRLVVYVGSGHVQCVTGDRVRFSSRISIPRNLSLPGEFDFVRYLALHSTYATAFVHSADDVLVVAPRVTHPWKNWIDRLALDLGMFIDQSVPGVDGAILRALLLGDMGNIPQETKDAYTRAGVNHILSISGFHVGIIAVCVFSIALFSLKQVTSLLIHLNLRRSILIATIPLLFFYLMLSGGAPATLRSVIMIVGYIIAMALYRETDPINSLLLAAFTILIVSPPALFDLSFQLSFLALWGIIVLTPLFMCPFSAMPDGYGKKLLLFLMASAAATIATIVPVSHYFHRSSLAGLGSNFVVVPLIGYGAVVAGFCALPFVYTLPSVAGMLLSLAGLLVHVADKAITLCAQVPLLPPFAPSQPQLLLSYLLLAGLTFLKAGKIRTYGCAILAVCFLGLNFIPARDSGLFRITFFSIGQGEASLITFPNGKHMLVDGGGATREGGRDVGERLLAPALWEMGVRSLDVVVLTHPHPDHMQGLGFILRTFKVGEFWEGISDETSSTYLELKRIVTSKNIPVVKINSSTPVRMIGSVAVEFLAPRAEGVGGEPVPAGNEGSAVFRLRHGAFSALFTGDIGSVTENVLLREPSRLRCTLLKVPHHGSRFSSTPPFLAAASPRYAVISAGFKNSFHLPAPQTVKNLHNLGSQICRTDLDGTIEVVCGASGEIIRVQGSRTPFSLAKL